MKLPNTDQIRHFFSEQTIQTQSQLQNQFKSCTINGKKKKIKKKMIVGIISCLISSECNSNEFNEFWPTEFG